MLIVNSFEVGQFRCRCSILTCSETGESLVVDPGDEAERIQAFVRERRYTVVTIVHTHAHWDHVLGTGALTRATGADARLHRDDRWLFDHVPDQLRYIGAAVPPDIAPPAWRYVKHGDRLSFGRLEAQVLHTPGHTEGSICLWLESQDGPLLFSGDTLFRGTVGRTDFPGGSWERLARSVQGALFSLPEHTRVVPGHGPPTTIGREREENSFFGRRSRAER
jgi:hydroxyacylglutathione hydrolase